MQFVSHKGLGDPWLGIARHMLLESWSQKGIWNTEVDTRASRAYRSQTQECTEVWETSEDSYWVTQTKKKAFCWAYSKSCHLPKFPETGHQVVASVHSPECSPELQCLLLFSESSSRSIQDYLAEMLSAAVTPFTSGYGNRKVEHLDANLFPNWEPRSHMSSVRALLPIGHQWHWWWMSIFLGKLCRWGARHLGFGEQ